MKVLMISTDKNILRPDTAAALRMVDYASLVDQLTIFILTKDSKNFTEIEIGKLKIIPISRLQAYFCQWVEHFDLVTTQDPFENGLIGWRLAKKMKAKLQLQVHTDLLSPYFWRESLKNKIRTMIAKWLLPKADGVRVVSRRIRDSLVYQWKINPAKITVLPIAIDFTKLENIERIDLKKQYSQFTKIVLAASRLTLEKNISLILASFERVIKQVPGAGLIIFGAGPKKLILMAEVRKLKIVERVVFVGWTDKIETYYHSADLFVSSSWYEGYGLTVVEALVSGCPVVSTDVGIAGEAGAVVADFTAEGFAEKMVGVLASGARGQLADQFKISKEDYLEAYRRSWQI